MAEPVLARANTESREFRAPLEHMIAALPKPEEDVIERSAVDNLTCAAKTGQGSLHQLVMDLHKVLNTMQAELSEEHLDGASVYRIDAADRPLISAFMAELNRSAGLKYSHPGLGTTVTRAGD